MAKRKPRKPSKPKIEPKWRTIERVVALLEKTLTPDGRVEHDMQLPDLRTGTLRQCDVVVRYGTAPRETLTIVEVQRRGTNVKLHDFQGWLVKRASVGAQHLIVVSAQGFSDSVIAEARLYGPSVRLVLLRELERSAWPIPFAVGSMLCEESMLTDLSETRLIVDANATEAMELLHDAAPVFEDSSGRRLSLSQIARTHAQFEGPLTNGPATLTLQAGPFKLHKADGTVRIVTVAAKVHMNVAFEWVPFTFSGYEQVGDAKALAWVLSGTTSTGRSLRATFKPLSDGRLHVGTVEADGDDAGAIVSMRMLRAP